MTPDLTQSDHHITVPLPCRMRRAARTELTDRQAVTLLQSGRLQPRDMAILKLVWQLGVVSASQIRRAFFYTVKNPVQARNAANRRLRWLYHEHCLDRIVPRYRSEAVYFLDIQGARLIRMQQNATALRDIHWSAGENGKAVFGLKHRLGITETVVQLMEAGRAHGFSVDWVGEARLNLSTDEKYAFVPDGLGRLTRTGRGQLPFFLEWDETTETIHRIAGKIWRYSRYARKREAWRTDLTRLFPDSNPPSKFPPLIFITTGGDKRLKNMLEAAIAVRDQTFDKTLPFALLMTNRTMIQRANIWGDAFFTPEAVTNGDFDWRHAHNIVSIMKQKEDEK